MVHHWSIVQPFPQDGMFRIRFITPSVTNEARWQHAGGELIAGNVRLCFLADLTHWDPPKYERQWRDGISRLVHGAPSTALMTAYRGAGDAAHTMWALWRDGAHVYVQDHSVHAADLDAPFDADEPYAHVGARIPAAEHGLPIAEWRVDVEYLHAAMLGIRWPWTPR
jgi:contact-dependent growth inhibition (CDI) system CdiI-like immunity protein